MKTALLIFSAISVATAFVTPPASTRAPTVLFKTAVEEEVKVEGAEALSGLTSSVKTVYTSEEIDKLLPHRYPFALVDKVVEYEAGKVSLGHMDRSFLVPSVHCSHCFSVSLACCRNQASDQE